MARGFNLTAELNLRGPANIGAIVSDIRRQLGTVTADVTVRVNPTASQNINTLNQSLNQLNSTLRNTAAYAGASTTSIQNFTRAVQAAVTASANLPNNMTNAATAANNLTQNANQASRATNQITNEFQEFGRQAALAVRRFAALATVTSVIYGVSNAISSASKEFLDFNRELVRVSQVTDTSVKFLDGLVNRISSLSIGLGVSSKELITVSSTLAQAGLTAKETEKALNALALSALAPSFDNMNETVEGSIALMRQFGISAGDLEKALGSVNAVAAKFAVEASDIITAIQRTGGVFATSSRGVAEGTEALNQFIAVFTSVRATTRESAETIATGLRTIFTRIQRADTIDALKAYGVALTDLSGKFVGPFEAVKRLSEGLSQLDPRDLKFSRIVEELGGFRQIGKVIPLIQQLSVTQQAYAVAQRGQASLVNDAATAQQALAIRITKVREEFIAMVRSIGQSEGFQTFVNLSLNLASALIKITDSAKGALPALTAIAAIRGAGFVSQFATGFVGGLRRRNSGGPIQKFARGGYVPGSGDGDTVPAMLEPGEFVIRKRAVQTIGTNNLHRMNKYGSGGVARDSKKTLENYFTGDFDNTRFARKKELSKQERNQLAKETKDLKSLRTAAPEQLYSSISRSAFDIMSSQTGLNKNPKIPEGTRLFDREKYYSQEVKKIVGRTFTLPGFVSTSKEFGKAKMFLDNAERSEDNWAAMMTIMTKKGATGVDVASQLSGRKVGGSKQTLNPRTGKTETFYQNPPESENEFILRPGSR
jgi:TP901 family phage tail tape measure protein